MFIRFVYGTAVAAALGWAAANYRTQQPRSGDEVTRAAGAGVKSKTAAQVKPQTVASAVTTREGAKTDPRNANEANRRLMEASEGDRRKLLQSTLSRAGESCAGVTRTFYQGSAKSSSTAFWNVIISRPSSTPTPRSLHKLYDRKTPITSADLLNDRVLPLFASHEVKLLRILTIRGSEYCGNPERHEYELYLAVEDIDHSRTKTKSPQTNGV